MPNEVRMLNGYRCLYKPDHLSAMTGTGFSGYVYEHRLVAEESIGRRLTDTEVVHHLDGNKLNNRLENLLVIERGQHAKLHKWLEAGAPYGKPYGEYGVNSGNPDSVVPVCSCCGSTLQGKCKTFCSVRCASTSRTNPRKPTKAELRQDINELSWLAIGRKYGVSDNAIRLWARGYGLQKGNPEPSSGNGIEVPEKVQRLCGEEPTNKPQKAPRTVTLNRVGEEIVQGVEKSTQT